VKSDVRALCGIHVLADDAPRWKWGPLDQARAACEGGAAVVQLRCKHATDGEALALAHEMRAITRDAGCRFIVNDRFDVALLCEADGVHLGQDDVPPARLPAAARERLLIGRSTHSDLQARAALREPIDYVAYGPVFGTASKASPWSARGLDALRTIASAVGDLPLVAIGGVDVHNVSAVREAGAEAAAVISAVADAPDPVAAVAALVAAFAGARA
jgi:thiamine-phosphate pyrophosphorylase